MSDLIIRGRYQIVPDGGGKAKAHTRVTNFAKKLEDGYTLTAWGKRMVLTGAAQRTDIIAATVAAGDDKQELDRLAEAAMEAAKANVRRETGTALHTLCEQVDAGVTVEMPSPIKEDIAAYRACMDAIGAKVLRMEEVVVHAGLNLAGRFDRLVEIDGRTYVMDLKTGADLSYSWLSISIQLAVYAGASTIYHPDGRDLVEPPTGPTHEPMPAVDQERALVVHLPAGEAKATPYWVDLETGRVGIELTEKVLAWRRVKHAAVEAVTPAGVVEAFPGAVEVTPWTADELRAYVTGRVRAIIEAGNGPDLASRWPIGVPTLREFDGHTAAMVDEILAACSTVEGLHSMPFPLTSDPRFRDQQPKITKPKGSK